MHHPYASSFLGIPPIGITIYSYGRLLQSDLKSVSVFNAAGVPVLRIHIRMFLGLLNPDPDPDPSVRGMDTDPSIIKQKQ
jgi:hypothetical protein